MHIHHVCDGSPPNSLFHLMSDRPTFVTGAMTLGRQYRKHQCTVFSREHTVIYYKLFAETCFEEKQMKQVLSVKAE